MQIQEEI